jgi:hypothetical protein
MTGEEIWADLEGRAPPGPGLVRRRVHEESARNLFLGVSFPARERVLVLVVTADSIEGVTLPSTKALRTTLEPAAREGESEVRVTLVVPEMAAVFTPFCEDVVTTVSVAPDDHAAVAALLERFAHWRRLLAAADAMGLSNVEAQGLYGELWVVRNLVIPALGDSAIEAWRGPDREDRDVLISGVGLEVKTTIGDEPATVVITNERQLGLTGLRALYLIALKLEGLRGGAGETLNQAIDAVRSSVGPEAAAQFRDKLLDYGYLEQHAPRYDEIRYMLREVAAFEVTDGFPRISEADLRPGVGHVTYAVALSACEPWRRALDQVEAVVRAAKADPV